MKIIALSSFCVDFFPEQGNVYIGGNSLNFATQCKLSGVDNIAVVGAIGNDEFGIRIEQHFDKLEIDRSHLYRTDKPTASNKIFINKQGDRYFKADSWNGGAFDFFRLSNDDWTFLEKGDIIAMPAGDPNLKSLLHKRTKEQVVMIDFLDYHPIGFIEELIDQIDIVVLSAKDGMLKELEKLAVKSNKLIIATLGAKGSVAFHHKRTYFQKALEVDDIVDTTGCGDAFQAAFVIEWFKSRNIQRGLSEGARAARKVLSFEVGVK